MPVSLEAKWKEIKVDYEAATDKKKPSDKFLGVFKKPSGLEAQFKALDGALKKQDVPEAQKLFIKLEKAAETYQKTLFKAASAETNKEVARDTKLMMAALADLTDVAETSIKSMATLPRVATLRDYAKLMKTPAADRIEAYAKKRFMVDGMNFLNAMVKQDYSAKTFKTWVKDNDINVSSELRGKFKEDNLKDAPWDEAVTEVSTLFWTNVIRELNSGRVSAPERYWVRLTGYRPKLVIRGLDPRVHCAER